MLLAQISDLHVRPTGQRYKDAVEHLNRLDPRPDLVLITGDLVDEGLQAEYDALRALLGGLELPAGPHRIDCAPPSGKSKTVSVTISEGASARYKFSLDD